MTGNVFIDTNALVYAYDRPEVAGRRKAMPLHIEKIRSEIEKDRRARVTLKLLTATRAGIISTQVLAEFFNTVTCKIATPLSIDAGYMRVQNFVRAWPVVSISGTTVLGQRRNKNIRRLNGISVGQVSLPAGPRQVGIPALRLRIFIYLH